MLWNPDFTTSAQIVIMIVLIPYSAALEFIMKLIEYEKRLLDNLDDPAKRKRLQDSMNYRQELNGIIQSFFNSYSVPNTSVDSLTYFTSESTWVS